VRQRTRPHRKAPRPPSAGPRHPRPRLGF
jgi:hypothetical protein